MWEVWKFKNFNLSDIIIRDNNFKNLSANKTGIIQLISVLPSSYPGYSILTEDLGMIIHEGNCQGILVENVLKF